MLIRTSNSEVGSIAAESHVDLYRHRHWIVISGNFCSYVGSPENAYKDKRPDYTTHFDVKPVSYGAWYDTTLSPNEVSSEGGTGFGPKGFQSRAMAPVST